MIRNFPWWIIIDSWCFTKWKLKWVATLFLCSSYAENYILKVHHLRNIWRVVDNVSKLKISWWRYKCSLFHVEGQCTWRLFFVLWHWWESDPNLDFVWGVILMVIFLLKKWLYINFSTKDLIFSSLNFTVLNSLSGIWNFKFVSS